VSLIGKYAPNSNYYHIWNADVYSTNYKDGSKTTYDAGAYRGYLAGIDTAVMEARFIALYIGPGGTKTGVLKGSLTGTGYPQNLMFEQDGTIQKFELGSTTVTPGNLYANSTPSTWTGSTSFIFNGYEMGAGTFGRPYDYAKDTMTLAGTDWSIAEVRVGGSYSGITPGSTFQWNITETVGSPYYTGFVDREITGAWASNGKITGAGFAYGADVAGPTNTPSTSWIGVGDVVGTFDANATTFQALWTGLRIDTNKYLAMAADLTTGGGQAKLLQLGIPACEVGIIPVMSGTMGIAHMYYTDYINLSIQNMRFFAAQPGGGTAPQIWATNQVSGTYQGDPKLVGPFTISGSGFNALFTVQNWNAGTGGNSWMGTITNGTGTLTQTGAQGLYNASSISFKGAAAGTHSAWTIGEPPAAFTGNAAGRVKVP
jgi:hypothetical protein